MRLRQRRLVVALAQRHEAEVDHLVDDLAGLKAMADDVLQLEIAVHETQRVRELQGAADRAQHVSRRAEVEPSARAKLLRQVRAIQVFHHQVRLVVRSDVEVEDRDDVRMAELRARAGLAKEARAPLARVRSRGPYELHGHVVAEHPASREVDLAHPAAAEATADLVLAVEDRAVREHGEIV